MVITIAKNTFNFFVLDTIRVFEPMKLPTTTPISTGATITGMISPLWK
jgi:hypothetical protein